MGCGEQVFHVRKLIAEHLEPKVSAQARNSETRIHPRDYKAQWRGSKELQFEFTTPEAYEAYMRRGPDAKAIKAEELQALEDFGAQCMVEPPGSRMRRESLEAAEKLGEQLIAQGKARVSGH
jgi:hypothetical protein